MATKKQISVIERRLQGKNALHTVSQPIPLKEKGWTLLWGNGAISDSQIWHLVNVLGWEYVTPEEIDCTTEEIGARAQDSRVVRGERGQEVLLKMRTCDYTRVQQLKAKQNVELTFNKRKVKDAVLSGVASEHGDQAASFINQTNMTVDDSRERVGLDE